MENLHRIFRLHRLISGCHHPVPMMKIMEDLDCSRSTVKRIIDELRIHHDAPLEYDRGRNGYFYDSKEGKKFELPGMWLSPAEMHSLLTLQRLLSEARPGLLDTALSPIGEKIERLLESGHFGSGEIARRVRILSMAGRDIPDGIFEGVSSALLERRKMRIEYFSRGRNGSESRTISPQRLVHYRDNWYLDAWCHLRENLRSFALECIREIELQDEPCIEIPDRQLDGHFSSSYGIFSGKPENVAKLRFTPARARWVSGEKWHPEQKGQFSDDGSFHLEIPYSDSRELIMDILKYGPDVEVLSPESLRSVVREKIQDALKNYAAPFMAEDPPESSQPSNRK